MQLINDVHQQFAEYFPSENLKPYLYLLSKKLSDGHICVDLSTIDQKDLLSTKYKLTLKEANLKKEVLVGNSNEIKPVILFNHRLYLQRYFNYETIILNRILEFIESEKKEAKQNAENLEQHAALIDSLFNKDDKETNEPNWPLAAAITAVINKFTIITGGPGTGKTTTVAKILTILFRINPAFKVALAAPTGKAAARMAESLKNASTATGEFLQPYFDNLKPSTIHRLLGNIKNYPYFRHNHQNPLNHDVVIIDESSMLDVALFAKLLSAIGPDTKLILLGDKDQLASIEAGSLFGDLCQAQEKLNLFSKSRTEVINSFIKYSEQQIHKQHISNSDHPLFEHIIELKTSHRFTSTKGIGKFSLTIVNNDHDVIKDYFTNTDDQIFIDTNSSEAILTSFMDGYKDFIEEKDISIALKKLNRLRILCAIREGDHGLYATNKKAEKYLSHKKLIRLTGEFYENRPIMVTTNNYELNLFNGDVGIIRPDENGVLKAWFEGVDGKLFSVLPGYISNAETVFAMTIHKSQGSEFDKVLIRLPVGDDTPILTRELLYTAITRAKENVIIQGSEELILNTAGKFIKRGSGIIDRFLLSNKI